MLKHSIFVLMFLILFYLFMLKSSFGKRFEKEKEEKRGEGLPGGLSAHPDPLPPRGLAVPPSSSPPHPRARPSPGCSPPARVDFPLSPVSTANS